MHMCIIKLIYTFGFNTVTVTATATATALGDFNFHQSSVSGAT